MKPSVYIESSVISYIASYPSRDLIVAAHQQLTHEWWERVLPLCEPFISQIVIDEITEGDPEAAARRLLRVEHMAWLDITVEARHLSDLYFPSMTLSDAMRRDAYHIALATVHGMDYLISWNCRHIVGGVARHEIGQINSNLGLETPTICTPEELMEL